jgi:23S rRNA pseudouridine1911/1915/1917 synthase
MPDPGAETDRTLVVGEDGDGERLDRFLAARLPFTSRSTVQRLIREGRVWLDGVASRASASVRVGQVVSFPSDLGQRPATLEPEALPIEAVFEDDDLLVLHKPPDLVIHPGAGRRTGTLVHRLLHRWPGWQAPGSPERPGIVHRLDRETSGLMVVARSARAYQSLRTQIASHAMERGYVTLVWGVPEKDAGLIDAPIGRDPRQRRRMAVVPRGGRPARTEWQVLARFDWLTLLRVGLRTGRTHQVRVHMASVGHPVFGDAVYGGVDFVDRLAPRDRPNAHQWLRTVGRVALHAYRLRFRHPADGEWLTFEAPVPPDMEAVLLALVERGELA